ncbi:hypothetical protein O0L34_g17718 [Tuta absoluta]|nr:hypothetical protein O0L34_g17718 [Tuta absoluta]
MKQMENKSWKSIYFPPLLAGATAGFCVDMTLYPLDTLKTRMQSQQGFQQAGGFRGVYKGLLTVASTSMPTSALFFMSYETTKALCLPLVSTQYAPAVHVLAASVGEVVACIIRVPTEIAKQRKQTYVGSGKHSAVSILWKAYRTEGLYNGVYRGFLSTVARDLPFSFIELPVWEYLKKIVRDNNDGKINSLQSALCGSLAGGFAAAVTTPLDFAKTRIMLAGEADKLKIMPILCEEYSARGVKGLFAGAMPRTTAFMLGGLVFFGVYDHVKTAMENEMIR